MPQVKCKADGSAPKGARVIRVGRTRKRLCWRGRREKR